MPFKETKEGATNYCSRCELEARGVEKVNFQGEDKSKPVTEIEHNCGKCKHGNFTPDCDTCFDLASGGSEVFGNSEQLEEECNCTIEELTCCKECKDKCPVHKNLCKN